MNNNFDIISNKYGKLNFYFSNEYNFCYKETIIYIKNKNSYFLLSDCIHEGEKGIKIINITSNINDFYNESDVISNSIELKTEETEREEETNNIIYGKINKCLSYTNESLKMNLYIECNNDEGYYSVNYKGYNLYPNGFKECFNNKTKLINFYFNKENKQYEPCYETCNT